MNFCNGVFFRRVHLSVWRPSSYNAAFCLLFWFCLHVKPFKMKIKKTNQSILHWNQLRQPNVVLTIYDNDVFEKRPKRKRNKSNCHLNAQKWIHVTAAEAKVHRINFWRLHLQGELGEFAELYDINLHDICYALKNKSHTFNLKQIRFGFLKKKNVLIFFFSLLFPGKSRSN